MNVPIVEAALIKVHQDIQRDSGYDPKAVKANTCPLLELPGFDSLLIPIAFRTVARMLDIPLPEGYRVPNIYVVHDGNRRLSISEIAGEFAQIFSVKAKAKAA